MEFDPGLTNLPELVKALKSQSSFHSLITKNEGERKKAREILKSGEISINAEEPRFEESKYSLKASHPELYYLDLTEHQAIVLNSWSYFGGTMPDVLTSTQKGLLTRIKTKLRDKSASELTPARTGADLAKYRSELSRWLDE